MLGGETSGLSMHGMGSILLLSTIPLLFAGAHCLDLLERRMKKSQRVDTDGSVNDGAVKAAALTGHARLPTATVVVLFVLLCAMPLKTQAQQTVFNVPTTDVLPSGKAYVELDISVKPNDTDALSHFSSFVPRFVVGAGRGFEVGLNVLGNVQPGHDSTTLVPAVKWKIYDGEDNGWAMVVGSHLYIPVRNRAYNAGNYSYLMTQKSFMTGTRVGFGGYFYSKNVVAPDANRAGGQFTFEKSLTKKLNVNADWFTGRIANGYLTVGTAYRLTNRMTGVAAYSFGNSGVTRGNHFIYFEAGYNLN